MKDGSEEEKKTLLRYAACTLSADVVLAYAPQIKFMLIGKQYMCPRDMENYNSFTTLQLFFQENVRPDAAELNQPSPLCMQGHPPV